MSEFKNPYQNPLPTVREAPAAASRPAKRRLSATARLVVGIAALALISAVVVGARPAYRVIKIWRASAMHARAEKFAAAEDWKRAVETLQAAYLLDPNNPAIIRSIAQLLTRFRQERALQFWERLVGENNANESDRLHYAELAVDLGRVELAERQLQWLREKSPNQVGTLLLTAKIARAKGDRSLELTTLREADRRFPRSVLVELALQRVLLESGTEEEQGKARGVLLAQGREAGPIALSALEILARNPGDSDVQRKEFAALLKAHPLGTIAHRLVALEIELDLALNDRGERAKLLDDFIAAHSGGSKVELETLATWLLKRNQTQRVLDFLPPSVAMQSEVLSIVRLDALVAQGRSRLKEIESDLENSKSPLSEAAKAVYRWFLALERGDTEGAAAQWRAALAGGAENPAMLLGVAKYMERRGELDLAAEAYSSLRSKPNVAREASLGLMRIAQSRGQTQQMRNIIEEMIKSEPEDPALRNDLAYLSLLLRRDLESSLQVAEKLVARFPHLVAMRTTVALAHLRANNPEAAKAGYHGITIDWAKATPSARAIYAAVLRENGDLEEAAKFIKGIRTQQLLPEERQLAGI